MKRDTGNLSARQRLALPIIAAEPTIDGAADKIGVTRKTVYEWLKQESFKQALEVARKDYVESAFRTLRLAAKRAAEKIVKHVDCSDERISLRAAEDIIEFTQKALENDELEKRIEALEQRMARTQSERSHHR
jgi:DNA-binding phage protein